jgi:aminoglycoside/choline kinase family phosphotransferase
MPPQSPEPPADRARRSHARDLPPELLDFAERAMFFLATARRTEVAGAVGEEPPASAAPDADPLTIEPLAGDGSTRSIYRAQLAGLRAVAVHNPLPADRPHPDENEGFLAVREFLDRRGVRVPAFYVADLQHGLLLLEDFGDERLYDRVHRLGWGSSDAPTGELVRWYEQGIQLLVLMQRPASPAFDTAIVPNLPYTEEFVLATEARYFHDELVRGFAGHTADFSAIESECRCLAHEALAGPARVFMHRDYQSRNLMLIGDSLAVIDFQGARLGPPEYDLAALLYDPYVAMPESVREPLIRRYLREASALRVPGAPPAPDGAWRRRFLANAADRLLQALGAFAKLGGRFGRPEFVEHIPEGLRSLEGVLQELGDFPSLSRLAAELRRHA